MIITCNNCHKKFDIDANLIPERGRLLQCNGCNNKWFFNKEILKEPVMTVKTGETNKKTKSFEEKSKNAEIENSNKIELLDKEINKDFLKEKDLNIEPKVKLSKNRKNYNILGYIIVFIISFIALIIILDTFQNPISNIIPNIEFLLYSLYETINDIKIFLKDLI